VTSLRIFWIGGIIAYRALFNWVRADIYIPTMLGSPLFQILFFVYLGRFSGVRDDSFFLVGNAIQVCAMSSIYGGTMAIANERYFGTLPSVLATPANRLALFLGRAVPFIANGLFISVWGFAIGVVLLDFRPAAGGIPALAVTVVVTVVSCTGFGLLLGSIGLRARDVFFSANLAYYIMLVFCGINIPLASLPAWMELVGRLLPLTHGVIAARHIAAGASLSSVSGLVGREVAIGAAYFVLAYLLFRFFEEQGRRSATLETH
jgi:ABC-2 type transport system permease protein